jgi:hypothetical protein
MELKNQVCSLEQAKKLKELGVKQESLFYFVEEEVSVADYHTALVWKIEYEGNQAYVEDIEWETRISAFTASELGEMLRSSNDDIIYHTSTTKVALEIFDGEYFSSEIEADARAEMLIYLLENKLISL